MELLMDSLMHMHVYNDVWKYDDDDDDGLVNDYEHVWKRLWACMENIWWL